MKHSYMYGALAVAMFALITTATPAHADVASSTATSTDSTATTTVATSTVATSTPTTTPVVVPAASTTSSAHIADLLAQLAKLMAIFNDLKAKLVGVQSQISEVQSGLHLGSSGDDVKSIQEALASDPTIYPSGLRTGFFGPMTVDAIKKFQAKNGLAITGEINAETKAALDTIMATRRSEGHFPMGLLIAPGQHRGEFENRLRAQCGVATSSTATTPVPSAGCRPLMQKYHMEGEGHEQGSSTTPWRPMNMTPRGGEMDHAMKYGQDWLTTGSSTRGRAEQEQEHGRGN